MGEEKTYIVLDVKKAGQTQKGRPYFLVTVKEKDGDGEGVDVFVGRKSVSEGEEITGVLEKTVRGDKEYIWLRPRKKSPASQSDDRVVKLLEEIRDILKEAYGIES